MELEGLKQLGLQFFPMNSQIHMLYKRNEATGGLNPHKRSTYSLSHMEALSVKPYGKSVEYSDFADYTSGRELDDIINSITPSKSTDFGSGVADKEFQENRYVEDPGNPGVIIDIRHLMSSWKVGTTAGVLIEEGQAALGKESGNNPQDYYSNELGADFFNDHYNADSDKSFGEQLNEYFTQRAQEYSDSQ